MLNALDGTHRVTPGAAPAAVLDRLAERLAADPACAEVSRTADGVIFRLDSARWWRWPALIGLSPSGGRIESGRFSARADTPRDLVSYTARLEVRPPLVHLLALAAVCAALAAAGWISVALAAVMPALASLRIVLRQRETEWAHRLIGAAARDSQQSTAAAPQYLSSGSALA